MKNKFVEFSIIDYIERGRKRSENYDKYISIMKVWGIYNESILLHMLSQNLANI